MSPLAIVQMGGKKKERSEKVNEYQGDFTSCWRTIWVHSRARPDMHGAVARGTCPDSLFLSPSPAGSPPLARVWRQRERVQQQQQQQRPAFGRSASRLPACAAQLKNHTMTSSTPAMLSSCPCHYDTSRPENVARRPRRRSPPSLVQIAAPRYRLSDAHYTALFNIISSVNLTLILLRFSISVGKILIEIM